MTTEEEKVETCRVAMKAALEAIQDYCGTAPRVVRIGGVEFQLPDEIYEIINSDRNAGYKMERIASHAWTRQEADRMCHQLIRAKDPAKCIHYMAGAIATGLVTGEELSDEDRRRLTGE